MTSDFREPYSPNIHSQYLRARYYSVVKASYLTEASYLGSIWGPPTIESIEHINIYSKRYGFRVHIWGE